MIKNLITLLRYLSIIFNSIYILILISMIYSTKKKDEIDRDKFLRIAFFIMIITFFINILAVYSTFIKIN